MALPRQSDALLLNNELDESQKRAVQRRVQAGELHRIAPGMATSLPQDQWPALMQREKQRVLNFVAPGAVVSHKSAFNALVGKIIYMTAPGRRRVFEFPGLQIIVFPGQGPIEGDVKMGGINIYWPSEARMLLDNLTRNDGDRNVERPALEERLLAICDARGEEKIKEIRLSMEKIGVLLEREKQVKDLGNIMGAILGTRPSTKIESPTVKAASDSFDATRVERFDSLIAALRATPLPSIGDVAGSGTGLTNFAFVESYFSNFIEGTEFEVAEARQIVLDGKISLMRPKDSHDILGVYRQIVEPGWRMQILAQTDGMLNQLLRRHQDMMRERPETSPGEFKMQANKAGNTLFVQPRLVRGTLAAGARRLHEVEPGLARALYTMFLIAEVHPFVDGNGRLARLVMNSELSVAGECRIIVPTLYRETYLDCLRVLTREGDPMPFIRAMTHIQNWTSSFAYDDLDEVLASMDACNAFELSLNTHRLEFPNGDLQGKYERPKG